MLEKIFPGLATSRYEITSPNDKKYNCIAWAAGDDRNWWEPDALNYCYWPKNISREYTLGAYIDAYGTIGYTRCGNGALEQGFEKIAIYVGASGLPSHAARQKVDGSWTSKIGQAVDISHETLDCLSGVEYGAIVAYLKRPIP
jgi:hypothetical protein